MKVACKKCKKEYEISPDNFPIKSGKTLSDYCHKCIEVRKQTSGEKVGRPRNSAEKNDMIKKLSIYKNICKKEEKRIKRLQVAKLHNLVKNAKDRIHKKIKKRKRVRTKRVIYKKPKNEITLQDKLRVITYYNLGYDFNKIGRETNIRIISCKLIISKNIKRLSHKKYLFYQVEYRRTALDGVPSDYFKALLFNNKSKMYDANCEECGCKYHVTMPEIWRRKKAFFKYGGCSFLCSRCRTFSKLSGNRDQIYIIAYKSGLSLNEFVEKSLKEHKHLKGKLSKWSRLVRNRDGKCMYCGSVKNLHAHHIKYKTDYPKLTFDVDNGITLCSDCHYNIHYN